MILKRQFGLWQFVAALGLIGLVVLTLVYGFKPQGIDDRLKKAEKLWKDKRYEEAISVYLKVIDEDPSDPHVPELLLRVGDTYNFSLNKLDSAVRTYDLITVRYPATANALEAYIRKGELYFGSDQFDKALREYQNILQNFPKLKEGETYELRLGICHLKLKQYEAARREFKMILDQNIKTPLADQVLFQMANSYFLEGNPNLAIPIYGSLIQNYPKSSLVDEAKFNMADSYEEEGEYDKALVIYRDIKNTYPNPKVIELQIQKSLERKAKAESRKEEMLQGKNAPTTKPAKTLSPALQKKREDVIRDIKQNYH